jgi:hypothetical protein
MSFLNWLGRTFFGFVCASAILAQAPRIPAADPRVDRMIARENDTLKALEQFTPVVETYIQEFVPDAIQGAALRTDHYFLGKLAIAQGFRYMSLLPAVHRAAVAVPVSLHFDPTGFAQTLTPDPVSWNRETYAFESVRTEFLGEVRCLVYDVTPLKDAPGRFTGRIWVEDGNFTIVRFNGTYANAAEGRGYAHFDSWRMRAGEGLWVPAFMYVEESNTRLGKKRIAFRGQTRFWGYLVSRGVKQDELASVQVRTPAGVKDSTAAQDISPLESQREWQRQAEDNILSRLERGGLLAPAGELDGVLTTVVNNLVVTNNLAIEPEIRCRILLTTPLEVFAIGNTIVISRGMLDVLPDEGTLAMALSGELAQIVLGNTHITKFAFQDLTMFPDRELLRQVHMQRSTAELTAGDARAVAILAKSPYKDTASMGLFLNALSARMRQVPNLVTPLMGDGFLLGGTVRMPELMSKLPESQDAKSTQVAALPLGGRIKVNPWNDEVKLLNARPAAIVSFRDNIPFEVTPFKVHLPLESTGAGKPLK